uniref:EamA domain-containing protein n=1 Tax=Globisporangium ultimum (strain ATCC 200006 / CBS 805.95 / DAOM BR144) TaxID=431595 RepID=K3WKZ0_GLOUD
MMKHGSREKLKIDTEVPSNVYALDLQKLSEIVQIPELELVRGMQSDDAVDMQGIVVNRGQEVPFEAVGKTPRGDDRGHSAVREVLITAASSTMCLEGSDTPKCLIQLGEYTLIEHILAQLFVAGMERVVIIISYYGHEIMEHVKDSFLYHKMKIEFLNLGEETPYGHARTLLSAREMFTKPFLIHTADHVFDKSVILRLASFDLEDCVACVLVDSDKKKLSGLPPTAGKVQFGSGSNIRRIGRGLKQFDAIDAGLFLTTGRIFAALEMLAYEKPKFSLAEALNVLRPSYGLKYVETAGDIWLSIETQEQLDRIVANDSMSQLDPWPVFVAKDVTAGADNSADVPHSGKNVFLAVSAGDDDSTLRAVDSHRRGSVFEGFVVGVNQLQEMESPLDENTPLLNPSSPSSHQLPSPPLKIQRKKSSYLDQVEESFVLSIPFEPMGIEEGSDDDVLTPMTASKKAYLIELPQTTSTRARGESQQFVLAVPGTEEEFKRPGLLRRWSSLPTDVTGVTVETVELKNGALELQVRVKRQVPIVGYILLLASLLTISSLGPALDMQKHVDPFMKLLWRSMASVLVFFPLAAWSIYEDGLPRFTTRTAFLFLLCSLSYSVFMMTFLWALNHTSIGHAYIFNNCHSLIMVIGRLLLGQYVSQFEGLGTGIGIIGGTITTLDHSAMTAGTGSTTIAEVSLAGDLVALLGAVGGVFYLISAKKLRVEMNVSVLLTGVFLVSGLLHFPVFSLLEIPFEFSTDDTIGIFGWVRSTRIVTELYIVLVCTLIGTLGYLSVMKYFDPIVVSVVMLMEPILASMMGVAVGVDVVPGYFTIGGSILIILGTALVIVSNASRTESIDATEAMSTTSAALPKGLSSTNAALRKPQRGDVNYV